MCLADAVEKGIKQRNSGIKMPDYLLMLKNQIKNCRICR